MNNLGEQLYDLICERYRSVPRLAAQLNMPKQTIYSMCRNGVTGSSLDTVIPVANALGIDAVALKEGRIEERAADDRDYVEVPVLDFERLDRLAAAAPAAAIECTELKSSQAGTISAPAPLHRKYPRAFFTRIPGAALNRILPDGCYALVDPCTHVDYPGKPYAIAMRERGIVAERVYPLANGLELMPDSVDPTYRSQVVDFGRTAEEDVAVVGRIVWYAIPFDWDFDTPR